MTGPRAGRSWFATLPALAMAVLAAGCGGDPGPAPGADTVRPEEPAMALATFTDVAAEVGLEFRHQAFQYDVRADPNAMMSGGLCWIDIDGDGWLDLYAVNTWSEGEWGRWREQGAIPSSRLFRNDRGRFTDVTDDWGAGVADRGSGCVAADLDLDGHTDLYVTTERHDALLWNVDGERFEVDDGQAGIETNGWHTGAAVGDVNRDGWPDLFIAGYADMNHPVPSDRGFPNPFAAVPDLLVLGEGADGRPRSFRAAVDAGIEPDRLDYGLGAVFSDVDRDGDLDLHVANDTQPNRLYRNDPDDGPLGFHLVDVGPEAGVDDENAGMGVAVGDYEDDGLPDLAVTNMARQGHAVFRSDPTGLPPSFVSSLDEMGLPDLGQGATGWGTVWADLDLDRDLDLVIAHGAIPVTDLAGDREQLQVFENRTTDGEPGVFVEVTATVVGADGVHLARGLAAADYDNDGDLDLAVGTIGGDLALLRNTGAGGNGLVVAVEPPTPGTIVTVVSSDRRRQERELLAGSSYLSSEDPRAHIGLGGETEDVAVEVRWPDGHTATATATPGEQLTVRR